MKPQDTPIPEDRTDEKPARKPYQKPELHVYGDLAEITKGVMGSSSNDGGTHPNKHFTA
jgi:hypothetical protein